MFKTTIVLPNGTEISSGVSAANAIQSVTITESVNDSQELTLGSACAKMADFKIITNGNLSLKAGDEVTVYKTNDNGQTSIVGLFTLEKPVRSSANALTVTAYDRITWLDKDLTGWLANLNGWPYTLLNFAKMACSACGLALANIDIPNGDYMVQAFSAQGITGRKLMQWIGEIAGRFCRATTDGKIEFAWYEPSGITISSTGNRFYYQNGLKYEDYETATIEKVQIHLTENDIGAVWPDGEGEKNTYIITGNYLLTTETTDALIPLAQILYEQLKHVKYTPCSVSIPACQDIHAGNTVQITDLNGKSITAYVMTKTQTGQRDTLECTGSYKRDSTTAFNQQSYQAISGKILEIQQRVEGFSVTAKDLETKTDLIQESVTNLTVEANTLRSSVSETQKTVGGLSDDLAATSARITTIEQTANDVSLQIQSINENGTDKVTTTTGYSFNENGMNVDKSDSPTKTTVSADGMKVYKKTGTETEVLTATSEGVNATNLHAKTYLTIGGRSRFENYGENRTGCYWIGG